MKVPQKRKLVRLGGWKMQREDGSFMILLLLSFHDVDSSGKPYLVQAYSPCAKKCNTLALGWDRYIILYTESGLLFGHIINHQKNKWNAVILDDWIVPTNSRNLNFEQKWRN